MDYPEIIICSWRRECKDNATLFIHRADTNHREPGESGWPRGWHYRGKITRNWPRDYKRDKRGWRCWLPGAREPVLCVTKPEARACLLMHTPEFAIYTPYARQLGPAETTVASRRRYHGKKSV